jgi:hypothetical protein
LIQIKELGRGDHVLNSKCSEWGIGIITGVRGDVVDVQFRAVGVKSVKMAVLARVSVESIKAATRKRSFDKAEYVTRLRLLVRRFLSIANRPGIEKIEPRIYEAFLGTGKGRAGVRAQLRKWVQTRPDGKHDLANADAVALWNFLFPEEAV